MIKSYQQLQLTIAMNVNKTTQYKYLIKPKKELDPPWININPNWLLLKMLSIGYPRAIFGSFL